MGRRGPQRGSLADILHRAKVGSVLWFEADHSDVHNTARRNGIKVSTEQHLAIGSNQIAAVLAGGHIKLAVVVKVTIIAKGLEVPERNH